MSKVIFISGPPRSGKSTVLIKTIELLKQRGLKVGGVITPEMRKEGKRIGFSVKDVYSGEEGILACTGVHGKPRLGKYSVNLKDFERVALKALDFAIKECDIICVDELAPMEMFSQDFRKIIAKLFKTNKPILVAVHRSLIKNYEKQGKVIWVTRNKVNEIVDDIITKLNHLHKE
ncbi:MAG: NTPase [Candidatus Aenigmarchaeota archaeon]|nr:NTPase [Candidatus Aenigmarchaeota archaeon]